MFRNARCQRDCIRCIVPEQTCAAAGREQSVKAYWEIIADKLSKAGWSWGCVATLDREARTIFVVDAHRGDGQRFVVPADEKLTAFLELESVIGACGEFS